MQQVELVGIKRFLNGIDDAVNRVVIVLLRHLVALSDGPAITLFKVTGPPGYVKMMDRDSPFLGIDPSSKHRGRAEQYTHTSFVHGLDDCLTCLLALALLDEADFVGRDAIVLYQLALDFGIDIPSIARLIRSKV